MYKLRTSQGFTLIELLVVIAIIGILASIVVSSLNTSRTKAADATIQSNINNMRSQAELWYDQNSFSYIDLCTQTAILNASASIAAARGAMSCSTTGSEFRISSPLVGSSNHFCMDNNGFAGETTTAPSGPQC